MKLFLMRLFAMRGTWEWALRQMGRGKIVRMRSGKFKYKMKACGLMCTYLDDSLNWVGAVMGGKFERATDWEVIR
ncbi:MAG TPA: hypothetical protein DCZ95_18090 [Verrucomicrobia bacterium]|nr:hypothetical protein [Verrucomicrobiota bacterium]